MEVKRLQSAIRRPDYETPVVSIRTWAGPQVMCTSSINLDAESAIIDYIDD